MIIDLAGALSSVCFPPYGDVRVWRASCRMFTKYFNPSNSSIDQPSEVKYVRRFFGCPRSTFRETRRFLFQHVRTYVPVYYIFIIPCQHLFLSCRFYRTIDDTQLQHSTPKLYRDYRRSVPVLKTFRTHIWTQKSTQSVLRGRKTVTNFGTSMCQFHRNLHWNEYRFKMRC